jgi:catechol 2,3-dioxygenase-like lactoylglutathione lyase family enzyme
MSMSTQISSVGRVIVAVADQDVSLDFYVNTLGFEKRVDVESPAGRWIEVAPPGATTSIALVSPQRDGARFSLATPDADALHADLQARGVDVDATVIRLGDSMPPMFAFRDPDGNTIRVSQQSEHGHA